jgi:transposase-like protein
MAPVGGVDYPRSYAEFRSWFPDDEACLDYLDWLRWPAGWSCPVCSCEVGWALSNGRRECASCGRQTSPTAGTIFHRTRTPLTVWFAAAWQMTSQKHGISALGLKRVLGLGSYQTAWAMLHRFRVAMVRPGRERLAGRVEVDETYVGGHEDWAIGRQTETKSRVAIAVEAHEPKAIGRIRLQRVPDVSKASLIPFVKASVEPASTVHTDGWQAYWTLPDHGYTHDRVVVRRGDDPAHVAMPNVHRVASLLKRWLLGTHQGAVKATHLQAYLNEFAFRFNRRRSRARGMLFYRLLDQAAAAEPITYRQLLVEPGSKRRNSTAPTGPRNNPSSLALPPAERPWRRSNLN